MFYWQTDPAAKVIWFDRGDASVDIVCPRCFAPGHVRHGFTILDHISGSKKLRMTEQPLFRKPRFYHRSPPSPLARLEDWIPQQEDMGQTHSSGHRELPGNPSMPPQPEALLSDKGLYRSNIGPGMETLLPSGLRGGVDGVTTCLSNPLLDGTRTFREKGSAWKNARFFHYQGHLHTLSIRATIRVGRPFIEATSTTGPTGRS